jgi:hypothetical protein
MQRWRSLPHPEQVRGLRIDGAHWGEEIGMAPNSKTAWEKAVACDAHAKQTTDATLRAKFERLRDSWIRIANNAQMGSATQASLTDATSVALSAPGLRRPAR